jgi:8-oxo-dGTP diphosphatase
MLKVVRSRGAAVLIENQHIGLIKRTREGIAYYVFPGGGIEFGETPQREVFEELGVTIRMKKLLGRIEYNGTQFYYLANIVGGDFGTGKGEEYTNPNRNRGTYEPIWVPVGEFSTLDIRPKEIKEMVPKSYN